MLKKIISKKRNIYLLFLINICLLSFAISHTYAKFPYTDTTGEDIVGVSLNFDIGITNIEEYEEIKVEAEKYKVFNIVIENINEDLLYYGIWYRMNKPTTEDSNIKIARLDGTSTTTSGSIDTNSSKTVSIIVTNKTTEDIIIDVGVSSSDVSTSAIEYISGKKLITGVDSPYIITMDNSVIGGNISAPLTANTGEKVTLTVTPNSGFIYAGATIKDSEDNTLITLDANTTNFVKPDEAVTVRPKWKREDYIVMNEATPSVFSNYVAGNYIGGTSTFIYDTEKNHVRISTNTNIDSKLVVLMPTILDLTNYDELIATVNVAEADNNQEVAVTLGAITDITTWLDQGDVYHTENIIPDATKETTMNCDISQLNGNYYVGLQLLSNEQITTVYWNSLILKGHLYE
ncbi:MAG: hypothetical protein IJ509_02530 [Bacilli bacterium]|nr:hypothetical protein [Bacilli bacterium]